MQVVNGFFWRARRARMPLSFSRSAGLTASATRRSSERPISSRQELDAIVEQRLAAGGSVTSLREVEPARSRADSPEREERLAAVGATMLVDRPEVDWWLGGMFSLM
jgi:hypothetical protein